MKSKALWYKSPTKSVLSRSWLGEVSPTSAGKACLNEGPSLNASNQNPCDLQKQRWHLVGKRIIHTKGEMAINAAGQQIVRTWEGIFPGGVTTTTVARGWKGTNGKHFESLSQWFVNVTWPRVSGGELVPSAEPSPVFHCFKHHGIKLSCPSLKTDGLKQQSEGISLLSLTLSFAHFVLQRLMLHAYINTK